MVKIRKAAVTAKMKNNMEGEIFKDHPVYGSGVVVSNFGRYISKRCNLRLYGTLEAGYRRAYFKVGAAFRTFRVHILVMETFGGQKPSPDAQVNHRDHNRANNHISNLEWVSPKENSIHAWKMRKNLPKV
jgi:hypothetical protein